MPPKMRISSGSAIGRRAQKTVGCMSCNFGEPLKASKKKYKLHDECPRCNEKSIRIFDSKAEFVYYGELKLLEQLGEIQNIGFQDRYELHSPAFDGTDPIKITTYVADFTYEEYNRETGEFEFKVIDVKGGNSTQVVVSPEAKLKMKWFEAEYGMPVTIIGR